MRKLLSLVMALTLLSSMAITGAFAPRLASAQEVGDTVTINDVDGNEVGLVTLEDLVDPFEDFDQDPEPGLRFISLELTIENTGDDPLTITPQNIGVVDDSGLIYVDVDINRTDSIESIEAMDLEAGEEITGGLEIGLPEESTITQIIWLVGTGQLPTLYRDLEPVAEGDEVSLNNADYEEEAIFIAEEVVDEYDDLNEDVVLNDGFKFVGVTVTIENTGEEDFVPEPAMIFLATTDGIFWAQDPSLVRSDDAIDEVDDLTDDPIAPGDSVTGFIGFGTPDTAEIDYVFYLPSDSTRLIHLYDADTSGGADDPDGTPEDDDTSGRDDDDGGLGPIGRDDDETPEADDETPEANTGDECAGAADWAEFTIDQLGEWSAVFAEIDPENLDAAELADQAEAVRDLADAQADSEFPPAAEELNDAFVQAFEDTADALDTIAEGVETDDQTLIQEGGQIIADIGSSFQDGDVAEILADAEEVCEELAPL